MHAVFPPPVGRSIISGQQCFDRTSCRSEVCHSNGVLSNPCTSLKKEVKSSNRRGDTLRLPKVERDLSRHSVPPRATVGRARALRRAVPRARVLDADAHVRGEKVRTPTRKPSLRS